MLDIKDTFLVKISNKFIFEINMASVNVVCTSFGERGSHCVVVEQCWHDWLLYRVWLEELEKKLATSWIVSEMNFISLAASLADTNSASIGERAVHVCFETCHWIGLSLSRIVWLDHDLRSSRSFAQDAST